MANVLKSAFDYVKMTGWDQPVGIIKDVSKGKFGDAFDDWRHTFGDNNDGEEKIFNSFGIRGWVGSHPTETAGAVAATILGGWAAAGAYGGGAAGGAAGTAGTGAGATGVGLSSGTAGTSAFSGQSAALSATPMSSFADLGAASSTGLSSGVGFGSSTTGATGYGAGSVGATPFASGSSVLSYAPSSSSVLGGSGGSLTAGGTVGADSAGSLAGTGFGSDSVSATPFSQGSDVLSYKPTESSVLKSDLTANTSDGGKVDINKLINGMQNMQKATSQQQQNQPQAPMVKAPVGRFNFQQPQSTAYSQAQSLIQGALQNNPYNTNPYKR